MAKHIYVGTGVTENYLEKANSFGYFDRLNAIKTERVTPFTVLLEFSTEKFNETVRRWPNITFVPMYKLEVKAPNPNHCLQHGAFIGPVASMLHLSDEDYIIFTDSDMTIQRPFTDEEVDALGPILVASNWYDGETLATEAAALQPRVPLFEVERLFPGTAALKCFNTGVLGASVSDWKKLLSLYVRKYSLVAYCFDHYARQQWLLCYLLQTAEQHGFVMFKPESDFVRTIHIHGHEPNRAERLAASNAYQMKDGTWFVRSKPVVFAHNLR